MWCNTLPLPTMSTLAELTLKQCNKPVDLRLVLRKAGRTPNFNKPVQVRTNNIDLHVCK